MHLLSSRSQPEDHVWSNKGAARRVVGKVVCAMGLRPAWCVASQSNLQSTSAPSGAQICSDRRALAEFLAGSPSFFCSLRCACLRSLHDGHNLYQERVSQPLLEVVCSGLEQLPALRLRSLQLALVPFQAALAGTKLCLNYAFIFC